VLSVFSVPLLVKEWDLFGSMTSTVMELSCGLLIVLLDPLGVTTATILKTLVSDVAVEVLVIKFYCFIWS
jgi:hypothetical protein